MKYILITAFCLFVVSKVQTLEYVKIFENDNVCVSNVKIMPHEEIGLHYDLYPQKVKALKGGVITRLESDGTTTEVNFPEGKWISRPAEAPDKMHKSVNATSEVIELFIVQLK